MNPAPLSRRDFVKNAALATAALQLPSVLRGASESAPADSSPAGIAGAGTLAGGVALHWLEGQVPAASSGVTWGVPWPRGRYPQGTAFALRTAGGDSVPVQSWPLAFWPDGSLKWTAHAIGAEAGLAETLILSPGTPAAPAKPVRVSESADAVAVDTGVIQCTVPRRGAMLIGSITRDGCALARDGRLVALCDDRPAEGGGTVKTGSFTSEITRVTVEQRGQVRAVVKIEGTHRGGDRAWLPFVVRLYFYAGAEAVRMMHSFVFDGDEQQDFIRGLGVRFSVPLSDPLHDRHVRFVGPDRGLWAEAVRGLTGLRRDPGAAVRKAQIDGKACPAFGRFARTIRDPLDYIPAWGDYSLFQSTASACTLRKRTKPGCGWVDVDQTGRAAGVGYVGGAKGGGVAFGLRDFWQRHPTALDIRGANTELADVTLWLWSPDAPAMDLRFYHDPLGMESHPEEVAGMEVTYEDYEKGWGTPHGIARSSELTLWALPTTPSRGRIVELAGVVRTPPLLACAPEHVLAAGVFGGLWSRPDRSTASRATIEDRLDWQLAFYRKQIEQRHWYGFWNYGDIMHTYDADRHVWRYDVGGFAWDNSELSSDLWLWYAYLRSGRADLFRLAEAMTRHTGEVDVYHLGRFAGLGSRHNVQHWGCSAKQVRISTAAYRRFYYYLTADERVGDLLRELLDADAKLDAVDPVRKLPEQPPKGPYPARVSFGTDWANLAAGWLTEWERGGDVRYRDKLLQGMRDIGAMPLGLFTSERFGYTPATGRLEPLRLRGRAGNSTEDIVVSHLDSVFGAVETFAELIQLTAGQPEYAGFERAWLQYCELYNATPEEQVQALGARLKGVGLQQAHSRLTAYAAWKKQDPRLAARAWREFARDWQRPSLDLVHFEGPAVLNPVDEAAWVSTNDAAQWGLAAMQNLALVPNAG